MAETRAKSFKSIHDRAHRWSREILAALLLTLLAVGLLVAAIGQDGGQQAAAPATKSSELHQR